MLKVVSCGGRGGAQVTLLSFRDGVCVECFRKAQFLQQYCKRGFKYMQWCVGAFGGNTARAARGKIASYLGGGM
jgi:hypothetical protein